LSYDNARSIAQLNAKGCPARRHRVNGHTLPPRAPQREKERTEKSVLHHAAKHWIGIKSLFARKSVSHRRLWRPNAPVQLRAVGSPSALQLDQSIGIQAFNRNAWSARQLQRTLGGGEIDIGSRQSRGVEGCLYCGKVSLMLIHFF